MGPVTGRADPSQAGAEAHERGADAPSAQRAAGAQLRPGSPGAGQGSLVRHGAGPGGPPAGARSPARGKRSTAAAPPRGWPARYACGSPRKRLLSFMPRMGQWSPHAGRMLSRLTRLCPSGPATPGARSRPAAACTAAPAAVGGTPAGSQPLTSCPDPPALCWRAPPVPFLRQPPPPQHPLERQRGSQPGVDWQDVYAGQPCAAQVQLLQGAGAAQHQPRQLPRVQAQRADLRGRGEVGWVAGIERPRVNSCCCAMAFRHVHPPCAGRSMHATHWARLVATGKRWPGGVPSRQGGRHMGGLGIPDWLSLFLVSVIPPPTHLRAARDLQLLQIVQLAHSVRQVRPAVGAAAPGARCGRAAAGRRAAHGPASGHTPPCPHAHAGRAAAGAPAEPGSPGARRLTRSAHRSASR